MNTKWDLINKEKWQHEKRLYAQRLENTNNLIDKRFAEIFELASKLPVPLSHQPSKKGSIALQLSLFATPGCTYPAIQSYHVFVDLFEWGYLCTFSLPARLIFELWGALHYVSKIIVNLNMSSDLDKLSEITSNLIHGSRSPVKDPWLGKPSNIKSINVMEFIRSLKDTYDIAEDEYNFLCESCHPSYIRLLNWSIHNWTNEVFYKDTHELINRTLKSVEDALNEIILDTTSILQVALSIIEEENIE